MHTSIQKAEAGEFEAILIYRANSRTTKATQQRDHVSENKKQTNKQNREKDRGAMLDSPSTRQEEGERMEMQVLSTTGNKPPLLSGSLGNVYGPL